MSDIQVQIFGTKKNADTRKAQRFFAERRIKVHFVDLAERAAGKGWCDHPVAWQMAQGRRDGRGSVVSP